MAGSFRRLRASFDEAVEPPYTIKKAAVVIGFYSVLMTIAALFGFWGAFWICAAMLLFWLVAMPHANRLVHKRLAPVKDDDESTPSGPS
jgi:hypothetical protein